MVALVRVALEGKSCSGGVSTFIGDANGVMSTDWGWHVLGQLWRRRRSRVVGLRHLPSCCSDVWKVQVQDAGGRRRNRVGCFRMCRYMVAGTSKMKSVAADTDGVMYECRLPSGDDACGSIDDPLG
jgi:hypothetical protein